MKFLELHVENELNYTISIYSMNWVKAKTFYAFFMLIRVGSKQIQKCSRVNRICSHRQFCTWSIIYSFFLCLLFHITRDEQFFWRCCLCSLRLALSSSQEKNEFTTKIRRESDKNNIEKKIVEKKVFKLNYCFWAAHICASVWDLLRLHFGIHEIFLFVSNFSYWSGKRANDIKQVQVHLKGEEKLDIGE